MRLNDFWGLVWFMPLPMAVMGLPIYLIGFVLAIWGREHRAGLGAGVALVALGTMFSLPLMLVLLWIHVVLPWKFGRGFWL